MSKFDKFLKDDAVVGADIATNTAGASGETSQDSKKVSKMTTRLQENVIKFSVNHENGVKKLTDFQEQYPDAVFTYNIQQDIIGDTSGNGIIEVSDIWYKDLKSAMTDSKWFNLS